MNPLLKVAKLEKFKSGELIHAYSHLDTTVYMLVEGEGTSTLRIDDEEMAGPVIEKGRLFGGLGLVRDNNKEIQVLALEDATAMVVKLKDLNLYCQKEGEEGNALFLDVLGRIQQFNVFLTEFVENNTVKPDEAFVFESGWEAVTGPDDEASYLMAKKYTCPVCGTVTESQTVRGTKLKLIGPGDFFVSKYEHIEPLWYDLVTCDSCGFTEKGNLYETPIKYNRDQIRSELEALVAGHRISYSTPRNLEEVVNGYVMYQKTMDLRGLDDRAKARGQLLMFELFQRAGIEEEAAKYRDMAYDFYQSMFASGILDVNDQQLQQLYLILGKLQEKRGEFKEAKGSYRNAKMMKGVDDPKFAELAEEYLMDIEDMMTE